MVVMEQTKLRMLQSNLSQVCHQSGLLQSEGQEISCGPSVEKVP